LDILIFGFQKVLINNFVTSIYNKKLSEASSKDEFKIRDVFIGWAEQN
jgi:hypothetical protein